jgi:hypothetical protein
MPRKLKQRSWAPEVNSRIGVKGMLPVELFLEEFDTLGPSRMHDKYGMSVRAIFARRARLEKTLKRRIAGADREVSRAYRMDSFPGRSLLNVQNGVVVVAGDAHYWPMEPSLMHLALVHFLKRFSQEKILRAVIMNGDVTDFASISRWPQVDWERRPTIKDEIDVCIDRMHEIATAAGAVPRFWPLGNHDARWSVHLANKVPEFANVQGMHLKDSFPLWEACWSVLINGNTLVKHTYRGGEHATSNNIKNAGCHVVTNHLHSAKVTPFTTMAGTLWGVDTGCLADTYGPQFLYLQDSPRNWRCGFAVLTYKDGLLTQPELVLQWDKDHVQFRGDIVKP